MKGKIFISYRREDARADARSIYQRLQRSFGPDQLFIDIDSIPLGSDFRVLLDRFLRQCKLMLVVIGNDWVDARNESGKRRLDDPADFVRIEVAMALARKVAVIPVLVDGAKMPRQDQLPDDIKPLVFRQSASLRHETFARDMDVLVKNIEQITKQPSHSRMATWAALALVSLLAGGVFLWPHVTAMFASRVPAAAEKAATYGRQSSQLPTWQRQVQPFTFKVEASANIARPKRLADRIKALSKVKIELSVEPRGSGPATSRMQDLSKGALDAVWDIPTVWRRSTAAVTLYSGNVPLGLDGRRHARWLAERGLRELNQTIREKLGLNIQALACYINPPEGFWLRRPVASVADLKGLSVRTAEFLFFRVAEKLEMKPVEMSATDFVQALRKGVLDGGEYSWPEADYEFGLGKEGLQYYFPGFHSPALTSYLFFNTDRWNALPAATRGLIEEGCRAQVENDLELNERRVSAALPRLQAQGVGIYAFPPDVVRAAERRMREVTDEIAAKDSDFKAAWASYTSYR